MAKKEGYEHYTKETYDASKYPRPAVTVDIVVFTIRENDLKILLVKRGLWPFKGKWAIPGGFVKMEEDLDTAAMRELREETNVKDVYLEQLYTFGEPKRDPRTRVITVTYMALIDSTNIELKATTDTVGVGWFSVYDIPELAFDHKQILDYALKRLQYKLEYTNAAARLLPEKFTLTELQRVYEIILDEKIDKRNFRKMIQRLDLVKPTNETKMEGAHRPAKLYKAKERKVFIVKK